MAYYKENLIQSRLLLSYIDDMYNNPYKYVLPEFEDIALIKTDKINEVTKNEPERN